MEQRIGDQVTVTLKRVSELASRTSLAYSESGVRSAISEVERRMERIRQLSREIGDELRTKEKRCAGRRTSILARSRSPF
ncbi:hypothetical protein HMSSN036_06620 [Paenibacillus macerans]|nr:hypothetical protein HMSSN036_06620 [Paenibacillus macerans]